MGVKKVFSHTIGNETGVKPDQVRKDFSEFKIRGNHRAGYNVDILITTLERIFTQAEIHNIIIVGMGNIGSAFARYNWFMQRNINIVATFDIDPMKQRKKTEITVYAMDRLKEIVYRFEVKVAIIAVPEISAQEVCDQLVAIGIKGILNFAPVILKAPREVVTNNVNLFDEVESVFYQVEYVMRKERV